MHKFRTYWHALKLSLTDPDYYYTLRTARFLFSLQFFLLTLFCIALFEIPNWAFRLLPTVVTDLRQEVSSLSAQVPEDAVFSYTGERLETHGVNLPMTLTASQKFQDHGISKNLITISDEEKPSSAALTFTPTQILLGMEDSPANALTYKDMFDDTTGSASRDQIRSFAYAGLDQILVHRFALAAGLALGGFIVSIFTGLLTIAFYSIMVQTIGWLLQIRLTYAYAFRWGLHIFPIALAIQEISHVLAPTGDFPILTVAYFAIATLLIWAGRASRPPIIL